MGISKNTSSIDNQEWQLELDMTFQWKIKSKEKRRRKKMLGGIKLSNSKLFWWDQNAVKKLIELWKKNPEKAE